MAAPASDLLAMQRDVEGHAAAEGLVIPEIRYEVVDYRELNEIAAYGGFPVRYPHWRFGMEYDRLIKGHAYGLQRIYELVVNTRPVVAYLLRQNTQVEHKLVMAHVCGHADFFVRNAWFSHTSPDMMDIMAHHGSRIRAIIDREGRDAVETFIDRVQCLDNLIDPGSMGRAAGRPGNAPPLDNGAAPRDVLGHLLLHAPLNDWQQETLTILRDEAYYFLPQLLTRIMNEGWASFWHSRLMTGTLLHDAEVVDYAHQHAGAMGGDDGPKNPYKLGIELYRAIYDEWGGREGRGLEKLFEVRAVHNDLTFVDNFMTEPFCAAHGMGDRAQACAEVRANTLTSLTNGGQPVILRRETEGPDLELDHCWSGSELQMDQAEETLVHLAGLWAGPVRLHTRLENRALLLSCVNGKVSREFGESVPPADPVGP